MIWSYLLATIGVFGLWLTTRKLWQGFAVGLAVQGLWIAYALATKQWGFIASAVAYGSVNTLGLIRWRKPHATNVTNNFRIDGDLSALTELAKREQAQQERKFPHA